MFYHESKQLFALVNLLCVEFISHLLLFMQQAFGIFMDRRKLFASSAS